MEAPEVEINMQSGPKNLTIWLVEARVLEALETELKYETGHALILKLGLGVDHETCRKAIQGINTELQKKFSWMRVCYKSSKRHPDRAYLFLID